MHEARSFAAAARDGIHFLFGGSSGIDLRIVREVSGNGTEPDEAPPGYCLLLQWRYAADGESGWRDERLCLDRHGRLLAYPSIPLLCGRPGNRSFEILALPVFLVFSPIAALRRALSVHGSLSPYAAALCRRLRPLLTEREYHGILQALIARSFVDTRHP